MLYDFMLSILLASFAAMGIQASVRPGKPSSADLKALGPPLSSSTLSRGTCYLVSLVLQQKLIFHRRMVL